MKAKRKKLLSYLLMGLGFWAVLGFWFAASPGLSQFRVYLTVPEGCRVVSEDMILMSRSHFYAAEGERILSITCGDVDYKAKIFVGKGDTHGTWQKGDEKVATSYE